MDEKLYLKEKGLKQEYEEIIAKEEIFWCQKSRETWLEVGHRNTKFFHNSTKVHRITNIKDSSGGLVKEPKIIADLVVNHFETLLNNFEGSNLNQKN